MVRVIDAQGLAPQRITRRRGFEAYTELLYACTKNGKWSSQSTADPVTNAEIMFSKERLNRSTKPSELGRYGAVLVLVVP